MGYSTSTPGSQVWRWPLFYLGVALTTLASLLLELSLTRIFSVVFHYHFAFLAISLALFGLGAGGVLAYLVAEWRGDLPLKLGALAACNSMLVLVALAMALSVRQELGFWALAAVYFPSTLPFVLSGATISLAIAEGIRRVDRVYFFDLLGAGAGCALLVPLLNTFGGPNTVLAAAAVFAASASIWFSLAGKVAGRVVSVSLALAMLLLMGYNAKFRLLDVKYAKGQRLEQEEFVKWNSFSRVAVAPSRSSGALSVFIDADASTELASFDLKYMREQDHEALLKPGPGLPYALRPGAKVLIIGPGGGWDVARALAGGSRNVTGVEINPIIASTVMQQRYATYTRGLYAAPEVRIVIEEGRSFIRRTREKFQVIQATLVDTWASTAAGAYALAENYLYTTNAFRDYLSHLTGDGLLAFTRWGLEPPRESLRLVSLAKAALAEVGEPEPWRHIIVVREGRPDDALGWGAMDTVLVARKPFSRQDLEHARKIIARSGFKIIYLPDEAGDNPFYQLLKTHDPGAFYAQYPYDVRPVEDDRPFFFYTVQPRDYLAFLKYFARGELPEASRADFQVNLAVPVVFALLGVSVAATLIMLLMPPLLLGARLPRRAGLWPYLLFFVCIGLGYILVEVALIQRFVLFLGHPTYALTVIVFAMLTSSGCGSFFSRRVAAFSPRRLAVLMSLITVLVALVALASGPLAEAGVGWPGWLKVIVTVLMIAPPAFLMGMPMPTGLSLLEAQHAPSVKWAWALNSASSVLGSVSALILAIYFGLERTLLAGGALYLVAMALLLWPQACARVPDAESSSVLTQA